MNRDSFKTGERFTLTPEKDVISPTGMRLVRKYLSSEFDVHLPNNFDKRWSVEKGELTGTFPTRVKVWLKKVHSKKMTSKQISEVGNIARRNTVRGKQYQFDFTDKFDWDPGDFGEKTSSCYWGDHSYARTMLREHDSLAIRFYGPKKCHCDCHLYDGECETCQSDHADCRCGCHAERKVFWCPNCQMNIPGTEGSAWWSSQAYCYACGEYTETSIPWSQLCDTCANHHAKCSCACHKSAIPESERECCKWRHQENPPISGYGRAWVVFPERRDAHDTQGNVIPDWDGFLVFNSYGEQLETTAQVLAAYMGMEYRAIGLTNQGSDGGTLYINDGNAVALSKDLKDIHSVNLHWDEGDDAMTCIDCGGGVDEDNTYYTPEGDGPYCESCYNRRFAECHNCGDTYQIDDMTVISHNYYCEGCRDDLFVLCDDCDRWTRRDEIAEVIGRNGETRSVGSTCAQHYTPCAVCDNYYPTDTMHLHGDVSLCQECHSKQEEFEHETEPTPTQATLPDVF